MNDLERIEEALAWADEYFTHPNVDVLAAALREARAEMERERTRGVDRALFDLVCAERDLAQAENERLREALTESGKIISAMNGDSSFTTSPALRRRVREAHLKNQAALAVSPPADEAKR